MRRTLLTPDLARAAIARVRVLWQRIRELLDQAARAIAEATRRMAAFVDHIRPALRRPDRPAWASSYGPAPRRTR